MNLIKILVAESDHVLMGQIINALRTLGFPACSGVASGLDLAKKIMEQRPGLIFIDTRLKGHHNIYEVAETININFNIPIIYIVSAYEWLDYSTSGSKTITHIYKPVSLDAIEAALNFVMPGKFDFNRTVLI